jgi:hypothetical protein
MYDIVCVRTISYADLRYRKWPWSYSGHRMLVTTLYVNIRCRMFDVRHHMSVLSVLRHLQSTSNFQKTPALGVCIWPESLLYLAPPFRPCTQCWHVRNTVIFYIKNGYYHTPIWWPQDLWTVKTHSLGVIEPHCTIQGAVGSVGCFYPDIGGAQLEVGGLGQWNGAHTMKCTVSITCVGLSMRVRLIEWAPMGLERQPCHKTCHEPMWIECFRVHLARVQAARAATQIVVYSPKKELWSRSLNMMA